LAASPGRHVTINRAHPIALVDLWSRLLHNRALAGEMLRRELRERYTGHALGLFWLTAPPVLTTLAYCVIFGVVFRPATPTTTTGGQIAFMLAGLLPWIAASDLLGRSSAAISGQPGLVRQMVFPVEILVIRLIAHFAVTWAVSTLVYLLYLTAVGITPAKTWLLAPVVALVLLGLLLGLAFAVASVGVFFRDIRDVMQLYLSIGLFVSPVLYDLAHAPWPLRWAAWLNPITPAILMFQDVFVHEAILHPTAWVLAPVLAILALEFGFRLHRLLRPAMGDVI
jgi:lipopolysaccharide transport system permease protein